MDFEYTIAAFKNFGNEVDSVAYYFRVLNMVIVAPISFWGWWLYRAELR